MQTVFELRTWRVGQRMKSKGLPDALIENLIMEKSQAMIYSHTGHGKSFVGVDIACHIATGRPYHGRKVKQGTVFYVAAEGADEIEQRMASWEAHHGKCLDLLELIDVPLQLHDEEQTAALREAMIAKDAAMVIFDTAEKTTIGTDENLPTQVNARVNEPLERIKQETGATVLLIHHQGSGSLPRWRGCTAWGTPHDTIMRVETRFDVLKNKDTPKTVTLQVEKQRGGEPFALAFQPIAVQKVGREESGQTTLVLEPITLKEAELLAPKQKRSKKEAPAKSSEKKTNADRIHALLRSGGPRTTREIADTLTDVALDTVRATLNRDKRKFEKVGNRKWAAVQTASA